MTALSSPVLPYNVYVDGIFDIPHEGHLNMILQAFKKGLEVNPNAQMVIGICDEGVKEYKRAPIMTASERAASLAQLIALNQIPALILSTGVPIKVNAEFLKEYRIQMVVRGDDFDLAKQKEYYSAAMEVATFVTVPYTPGISTSQILRTAKQEGKLDAFNLKHITVSPETLVQRIQSLSWEALNLKPA